MSDKNRSHGKIDNLPEPIKNSVNEKLIAGEKYEEISSYLSDMGHDVHISSICRYGKGYLKRFEGLQMARQFSKLIAEDNIDRPTTELHEANNALISQIIMEAIIDEDLELEDKIKAAKSVAALQSAQVRNEKLKIDARKSAGEIHAAMNILKMKVFEKLGNDYPAIAESIMNIADDVETETTNAQNAL
jgi:hypothetical protein